MIYTEQALRADLKELQVTSFNWDDTPGKVRPDILKRNPWAKGGGYEEVAEYCWTAYRKAFRSTGDLVIGRVDNLQTAAQKKMDPVTKEKNAGADLYRKVAGIVNEEKDTLFDDHVQGNLLRMDKWATVVNDSWVLGGVHRQGKFRLSSPRVMDNLWNQNGYFIVTAREILGLLTFGYRLQQIGPWQIFVCVNRVKAMTADLMKYHRVVKSGPTLEQARKLQDSEGSSARAAQQVQAFKPR